MLDFFKNLLPTIMEFFEWIFNMNDDEFEEISKSWPAPIKTSMAKARFEAKLLQVFPDKEGDGS